MSSGATTSGTGGGVGTGGAATGASSTGASSTTTGAGATSASGGATTGGFANDACSGAGTETVVLTYASDLEGFVILSGNATVTHSSTFGSPDPGAMEVMTSSNRAIILAHDESPAVDMTGRTLSANVFIQSGSTVQVWLYVQTGSNSAWTDSQYLSLASGVWNCITMDMSNPDNPHPEFDPADVRAWGIRITSNGGFEVYVDQFAY